MPHPTPWLRPADRWIGAVALLLAAGCIIACGGGPQYPRPVEFAAYPPNPSLDRVIETHVNAARDPRENRVLLTTWFLNGDPRVAQFCSVRPDGKRTTYQYVDAASFNAMKTVDLTPETVQTIERVAATLPPSHNPRPPLANLLIVSFRRNGVWQTRLYNINDRPPGVSQILSMINADVP
jgi:hypothetical protein